MSVSTAIGMVSESLRNLLIGEMRIIPAVNATVLAPDETGGDRRINLFLYKVQESASLKNLDWQVKRGDASQLVPPPLSLNLYYLMTPYTQNDPQTGNATAHEILGEAMRVFYENPIVPPTYLAPGLQDAREQIQVMLNTLDLEELSRVWATFTQPYRLSILYEVSVVQLDTLPDSERPMAPRVQQIGAVDVEVKSPPPVVHELSPMRGPVGSVITVQGENLVGWRAYVTILGRLIVNGMELTSDTFTVTIPPEIPPGLYHIRVDISHLYRRTLLFEVTS